MKTAMIILLFAFSSIESRKLPPISKHANVDFINMETGGQGRPTVAPVVMPTPAKPITPQQPTQPIAPVPTAKPVPAPVPTTQPPKPIQPQQPKPNQRLPSQIDLKPVQPAKPAGSSVTTPGPGNVQQLVTFYDSQGKGSPIRPYSYSTAVKKGKV